MKTVIEMAKQAGFDVLLPSEEVFGRGGVYTGSDDEISKYLERFAELVRADERERIYFQTSSDFVKAAIADEREACAQLCDRFANRMMSAEECAAAIRARGSNA